jgi:hypothetical protein
MFLDVHQSTSLNDHFTLFHTLNGNSNHFYENHSTHSFRNSIISETQLSNSITGSSQSCQEKCHLTSHAMKFLSIVISNNHFFSMTNQLLAEEEINQEFSSGIGQCKSCPISINKMDGCD